MRNEATLDALVSELQFNCGDTLAACRTVGVSLMFVNQWRKDDKIVDEKLTEAAAVGTQGLVSAAIQRGVHGVEEDVWYRGEVAGQKRVYSDGLLQTLLKAKVQEFKADSGEGVHVQVNVANLMPRAANYDEWLQMKDNTLNRALPAPSEEAMAVHSIMAPPEEGAIDAEFAEVIHNPPTLAFAGIDL